MFIVIEGIDGSGKSTQIDRVSSCLKNGLLNDIKVDTVKFPIYKSPPGLVIEKLLSSGLKNRDSQVLFQSLMVINRQEFFSEYTFSGNILIADRYSLSGIVYGLAQGLDLDWLSSINSFLPIPFATFYLDVPVDESFARRPERRDVMESSDDFMRSIHRLYKENLPHGSFIIDGTQPESRVTSEIIDKILLLNPSLIYQF